VRSVSYRGRSVATQLARVVTALSRRPPTPAARQTGLPSWAIIELDGLLSAGLLDDMNLVDLSPDQLTAIARESFLASRLLFEEGPVIEAIRAGEYVRFTQARHS
jgi:hypothetical protein